MIDIGEWSICGGFTVFVYIYNAYKCIYVCVYIYIYNQTSLNRPAMGLTLYGPFREMIDLGNSNIGICGRSVGIQIKRSI